MQFQGVLPGSFGLANSSRLILGLPTAFLGDQHILWIGGKTPVPFFKTFATKGVGEIVKEAAIKAISIAIPGTPVVASFAGSISKILSDVRTPLGTLNSNSTVQGDQLTSYEAKSSNSASFPALRACSLLIIA